MKKAVGLVGEVKLLKKLLKKKIQFQSFNSPKPENW